MRWSRKKRGFTLIELMVVIAIIGLLSTIILNALRTAQSKAGDARRAQDAEAIVTALSAYSIDHTDIFPCIGEETTFDTPNFLQFLVQNNYINAYPQSPPTQTTDQAGYWGFYQARSFTSTPNVPPCNYMSFTVYLDNNISCPAGMVAIGVGEYPHPICTIIIPQPLPCPSDPYDYWNPISNEACPNSLYYHTQGLF